MSNHQSFAMSTILSILFALTCTMAAYAMQDSGEIHSASSSTSGGCQGEFAEIYKKFMNETPDPESPEAVELIEKAINVFETNMSELDKQRCQEEMVDIGDLKFLLTDTECTEDSLVYRNTTSTMFLNDGYQPKVIEFVKFHNNKQFQECKTQLERRIQLGLREIESEMRYDNLIKLLQSIQGSSHGRLSKFSFRRDVVAGFNNYLKSTGFGMDVPAGIPLNQHLDDVKRYIDGTINADCHPIVSDLTNLLFEGEIMVSLADKLHITFNWSESTKQIMQLASICNIIKELGPELYLVNNYNMVSNSNVLYDDTSDDPLDIEQVASIAGEMVQYYQARQAVYEEDHESIMNDLNGLVAIQGVGPQHCETTAIRMINRLYQQTQDNIHFRNFVEHYSQRLLTLCLPIFENELRIRLENYPRGFKVRIDQIYENMRHIMGERGTPLTNRSVVPRDLFHLALAQFLRDNGVRYQDPNDRLVSVAETLILIPCVDLLNSLGPQIVSLLDELSKLDRIEPSKFSEYSEGWANGINICQAIAQI